MGLKAESVKTYPYNSNRMTVELEGVEIPEVLEHITVDQAIDYYDEDDILDSIGVESVKKYFNLIDATE